MEEARSLEPAIPNLVIHTADAHAQLRKDVCTGISAVFKAGKKKRETIEISTNRKLVKRMTGYLIHSTHSYRTASYYLSDTVPGAGRRGLDENRGLSRTATGGSAGGPRSPGAAVKWGLRYKERNC